MAQVGGHVGVDARTRGRRRRASRPSRRRRRPARRARRGRPRTARPARSRAAQRRRRRANARSVVGSAQRARRGRCPCAPGHDASSSTSNAGSSYGWAARSAATTAARSRRGATISTRASTTRDASPADPIVGVAASDGVNVPSPVDVHAHRVYSPIAPAPAAASASTRRSASPTGTNTTCLSSASRGRGVQRRRADEPERRRPARPRRRRPRRPRWCARCTGRRRERTSRCSSAPLNVVAAIECTGRSSSGWWVTTRSAPHAAASSTTAATGSTANSTRRTGWAGSPVDQADRVPRLGGGRRVAALEQPHDVGQARARSRAARYRAAHRTLDRVADRDPARRARGPSGCRTTPRRPSAGAGRATRSGSGP